MSGNLWIRALGLAGLSLAVACSDSTGLGEYEGVRVVAEVQVGTGEVLARVENGSAFPITRHDRCHGDLQTYEGWTQWAYATCLPTALYEIEPPVTIPPGGELVLYEWPMSSLSVGVYRFRVDLRARNDEPLPDAARISNWFRVEDPPPWVMD